mgnify:CR=1 FL=1
MLINNVEKRMKKQGVTINVDDKAKDLVAKKGVDDNYGARPLKRAIQNMIEDKIADAMLDGVINKNANITADQDQIIINK